jgi:hypothetical protein
MFHVGQKVVCVDDSGNWTNGFYYEIPVKGRIYTIRDIDTRCVVFFGKAAIRVEEIILPIENTLVGEWEPGYSPDRFRPVIERKTDISVFTRILDKVNKRETVNG